MGFSVGAIAINSQIANIGKRTPDGTEFRAAIALYGHCREIRGYDADSIPLMEIAAEKDVNHAPSCIYTGKNNPDIEVHVIKGAYHAFDKTESSGQMDSGGSIMLYSAGAVTESEKHVRSFLAKHLRK